MTWSLIGLIIGVVIGVVIGAACASEPPEPPAKRKQGINWVPVAAALLIGISLSGDDDE